MFQAMPGTFHSILALEAATYRNCPNQRGRAGEELNVIFLI